MIFSRTGWLLLGGAVAATGILLLRDETVQKELKKIIGSSVKIYDSALEGLEIIKEDVEDFVAEASVSKAQNTAETSMDDKNANSA